jgi:hypothetical protein
VLHFAATVLQVAATLLHFAATVLHVAATVLQLAEIELQLAATVLQLAATVLQLAATVLHDAATVPACNSGSSTSRGCRRRSPIGLAGTRAPVRRSRYSRNLASRHACATCAAVKCAGLVRSKLSLDIALPPALLTLLCSRKNSKSVNSKDQQRQQSAVERGHDFARSQIVNLPVSHERQPEQTKTDTISLPPNFHATNIVAFTIAYEDA